MLTELGSCGLAILNDMTIDYLDKKNCLRVDF